MVNFIKEFLRRDDVRNHIDKASVTIYRSRTPDDPEIIRNLWLRRLAFEGTYRLSDYHELRTPTPRFKGTDVAFAEELERLTKVDGISLKLRECEESGECIFTVIQAQEGGANEQL